MADLPEASKEFLRRVYSGATVCETVSINYDKDTFKYHANTINNGIKYFLGQVRDTDTKLASDNFNVTWKITRVQTHYVVLETVSATHSNTITPTATTAKPIIKKEPVMNTNSMRDQLFREIKNVVIDIQSGKLGFVTAEGIATYNAGTVTVNPLVDFGVKVPAFAMRIAVSDLKSGDIIISGQDASFFKSKTDTGYETVTLAGEVRQVGSVSNMFFGKDTVLAVKNMFGDSMNPMMMALMLGQGEGAGGFDMKTFALMSMMGNSGAGSTMDPMMLMLLMGNK